MKVLAISGFKKSGKDTIANYLIVNHNFKRVALADPLKDFASKEYGIPRADFDDISKKESPIYKLPIEPKDEFTTMLAKFMWKEFVDNTGKHPENFTFSSTFKGTFTEEGKTVHRTLYHSPRSLAILKGSSNRFVTSDFWVQKASEVIKSQDYNVVIPDLRYKNEIAELQRQFGRNLVTLRINRFDKVESNDPSELDLLDYSGFDFTVENKGTLEELYSKTDGILVNIKVK